MPGVRLITALGLLLALAAPVVAEPVKIAIIIDDLGNSRSLGRQAVALPGSLTYAVLPMRPYSADIAREASDNGKEVMLHLPMAASDGRTIGAGGLHLGMDRDSFAQVVRSSVQSMPQVVGVNNHMGSLLTRHDDAMQWLMEELRCFNRLYFVDSRTDVRTVARRHARTAGLAHAARDVFLDNEQDAQYIRGQLDRLVAIARKRGSAIGIGHPYPETLDVLERELPRLADRGIELVPVSQLVQIERNELLWHASSSPLPTVAKNSKP